MHIRNLSIVLAGTVALAACGKKVDTKPPEKPPETVQTPPPVAEAPKRVYQDPPPPSEPRPVQFPDLQKFTTRNGIDVYVVENHEVPLVNAQLVIRAGTMDDEQLAQMTASILGEGTKTRSKAKIDEEIELVGGSLGAAAGTHDTSVYVEVLKKDLKLGLTLMADEVINPAFPADALKKLQDKSKAGLKAAKSNPDVLADTLFGMAAYPEGHPYGRPLETDAQIDGVTIDALKKFHNDFYRSNNSYLILSGDITPAEAQPLVESVFGKWKPISGTAPVNPLNNFRDYKLPQKLVVHLVDRPGSAQSEVRIGNLALARKHQDWIKFQIASDILGGGSTGRLFLDVREEKSLTYGVYARMQPGQAPGTWSIWTKTKTSTTDQMLTALFGHIKAMRSTDPSQREFDEAITETIGSFPLGIETAEQVAGRVRTVLTFGLAPDYWKTYRDEVRKVQLPDVKAMSAKYMHAVPVVVIVGRADKVEPQIKSALPDATIVKYNTDLECLEKGNPLCAANQPKAGPPAAAAPAAPAAEPAAKKPAAKKPAEPAPAK
jgi:predicted Zn-dependent peptidase